MPVFNRRKQRCVNCDTCELLHTTTVWGTGNRHARIAIVGEAPGKDEDREGVPFIGAAGRLLNKALYDVGLQRNGIWITNRVCCRPPENKIDSLEGVSGIENCTPGLHAELKSLPNLKVVIALGRTAMNAFGIHEKISKVRGSLELWGQVPIIPTYHPSFIIRGKSDFYDVWVGDIRKALRVADDNFTLPREQFNINPTFAEIERFVQIALKTNQLIACDVETTALHPWQGQLYIIGFASSSEDALCIRLLKNDGSHYWNGEWPKLKILLKSFFKHGRFLFQNASFDVGWLEQYGFTVNNIDHDIMLLHHAFHPDLPHNLGYITAQFGLTPYWKEAFGNREGSLLSMNWEEVATYNCRDCVVLHQNLEPLQRALDDRAYQVYKTITLPLIKPVLAMHNAGLPLDKKVLGAFKRKTVKNIAKVTETLTTAGQVPPGFNWNSNQHLLALLFNIQPEKLVKDRQEIESYDAPGSRKKKNSKKYRELCAKVELFTEVKGLSFPRIKGYTTRYTDGGVPSTADDAIGAMIYAANRRLNQIKKFRRVTAAHRKERRYLDRELAVLVGLRDLRTYTKLLANNCDYPTWPDGRVHPSFKLHGTATGRLSSGSKKSDSADPGNLQNIPKEARKPFKTDNNHVLVTADYTNFEVAIIAYLASDDVLIKTVESGENVHDANVRLLFGVDKDHPMYGSYRAVCKTYRFARNYGSGLGNAYAQVMSRVPDCGLTYKHFCELDAMYMEAHPQYAKWVIGINEQIKTHGKLYNAFGRVRKFDPYDSQAEQKGLNFPVQSTAADIINQAMVRVDMRLKRIPEARLILQLHDALYIECLTKDKQKCARVLQDELQTPVTINGTPRVFKVDIKTARSWGDL